ncbi:MAG: hypothetical protein KDD43_11600, partial [Bdellovibrionales bacterium]|nr:hypothetical protein [Bdellovibrionales bacterium]
AGHSLYKGFNLQLMGAAADDANDTKTAGAAILYGMSDFGFSLGATAADDGDSTTDEDPVAYWGLGFHLSSISTSIGFSGYVTKDANDKTVNGENVGILINPGGRFALGLVAYNAFDDVSAWGIGFNFGLNSDWSLSVDAIDYDESDRTEIWPGVKYSSAKFEFAGGMQINEGGSGDDEDFFISLGIKPWSLMSLQLHYQLIQKYYAGLQISF